MASYPPSQPVSSSSSSSSWLPRPLASLAAQASFAWQHASDLAVWYLYARDPLVSAYIFGLPLIEFCKRMRKSGLGEWGEGREEGTTEAFVLLPPSMPVLALDIPAIPAETAYYLLTFHDPFGECLGTISTSQTGGAARKVVLVGSRTIGRGLCSTSAAEGHLKVIETDSDIVLVTAILVPRDPEDETAAAMIDSLGPIKITSCHDSGLKDSVQLSGALEARVSSYTKEMCKGDGVLFSADGKEVMEPSKRWKENHLEEWDVMSKMLVGPGKLYLDKSPVSDLLFGRSFKIASLHDPRRRSLDRSHFPPPRTHRRRTCRTPSDLPRAFGWIPGTSENAGAGIHRRAASYKVVGREFQGETYS